MSSDEQKKEFEKFLEKFKNVESPTLFESAELIHTYMKTFHSNSESEDDYALLGMIAAHNSWVVRQP